MDTVHRSNISISLILFVMVFSITFVSVFTYFPIYANTIEQKTTEIKEDAKLQALLLKQVLTPVNSAKSEWRKQRETARALTSIAALWNQLKTDKLQQQFYLIYKNPSNNKVEVKLSSHTDANSPSESLKIQSSMYLSLQGNIGIQSIVDYTNTTLITAYAPIIEDQWGIVVKYQEKTLTPSLIEALKHTLYAALLITLIGWLIFLLVFRSKKRPAQSIDSRYHKLLENSSDWIWEVNQYGNITYSSPKVETTLGYTESEVLQRPLDCLFNKKEDPNSTLAWQQMLMLGKPLIDFEIAFRDKSNNTVYMLVNSQPILDKHLNISSYTCIAKDISKIKNRENKVRNMALYDSLTGLTNRTHFIDKLRKHLLKQKPNSALTPSALLFIDLDGFKDINDTHGHEIGDKLLKVVALRMSSHARQSDVVARLGGDEFVILVQGTEKALPSNAVKQIEKYTLRLLDSIREPINIENEVLNIQTSIGIAMIPIDGKTVTDVLNHADTAMYAAKKHGKNTYQFYDNKTQMVADHRLKTSAELRQALDNNEFDLYYQLQYETHTKKVIGMEAFLRWHHPDTHKTLAAQAFLETAEGTNNIKAIDQWVINRAAQDIAKLNQQSFSSPPVSINLSTKELEEYSLPQLLESTVKRHFISPQSLTVEITESSLIHDIDKSNKVINGLKSLGVNICIDNFGKGYTSLSYLQTLPVKSIKIDKSFVNNIATSHSDLQMCRTILQLGQSLQLDVIAEGVEATVQKDILEKEGCHYAQGYLFSHPAPLSKIITYLNDNPLSIKS